MAISRSVAFWNKITMLFLNFDIRTVVSFCKRLFVKGLGQWYGFLPLVFIGLTQCARYDGHSLALESYTSGTTIL